MIRKTLILIFITLVGTLLIRISDANAQYYRKKPTGRINLIPASTALTNNQTYSDHESVLIILDASYSMSDKVNGERKIDIAKRVINEVLGQLSTNVWVGLRIYGHKTDFLGLKACRASELKVPIQPNSQQIIRNILSSIQPVGWTPITYSIQQAVNYDFAGISGKKRIILVSDGMETCDNSPCEYVVELVKNRVDLKIDVIGFDLSDEAALSQLRCTALATKGKFYSARNANDLTNSLINSLNISKDVQGTIIYKNK